jgi:hypothetical protein
MGVGEKERRVLGFIGGIATKHLGQIGGEVRLLNGATDDIIAWFTNLEYRWQRHGD